MSNSERPAAGAVDQTNNAEKIEELLAGSDSYAYFKKNGIKPPSGNTWTKVLFELGPDTVEKNRVLLEASADRKLSGALKQFNPEAARDVAGIGEDDAEETYKRFVEEVKQLPAQIMEIQAELNKIRAEHATDPDMARYVDEFEDKLDKAKSREKMLNDQLSLMEAVFYIPEEVQEERFRQS